MVVACLVCLVGMFGCHQMFWRVVWRGQRFLGGPCASAAGALASSSWLSRHAPILITTTLARASNQLTHNFRGPAFAIASPSPPLLVHCRPISSYRLLHTPCSDRHPSPSSATAAQEHHQPHALPTPSGPLGHKHTPPRSASTNTWRALSRRASRAAPKSRYICASCLCCRGMLQQTTLSHQTDFTPSSPPQSPSMSNTSSSRPTRVKPVLRRYFEPSRTDCETPHGLSCTRA
jgi:hypothetical protein